MVPLYAVPDQYRSSSLSCFLDKRLPVKNILPLLVAEGSSTLFLPTPAAIYILQAGGFLQPPGQGGSLRQFNLLLPTGT